MRDSAKRVFEWLALPLDDCARAKLSDELGYKGFDSLFTHIRAFHGCRPVDVSEYLRRGLRPLSHRATVATARRLFLGKGRPPVTEPLLRQALNGIVPDRANGRVYLAIDERHLLEYCGHYMVYGSDAVAGVAAQLTRGMGWNVQTLLLTSGTPTVFAVDVPCSAVSGETLTEVTKAILEELGCEADKEPSIIDFTLAPGRALPADSIVRYYSVHRLHDPILWQEYVHRPGSLATIPTR